jgi:hypothetical protein
MSAPLAATRRVMQTWALPLLISRDGSWFSNLGMITIINTLVLDFTDLIVIYIYLSKGRSLVDSLMYPDGIWPVFSAAQGSSVICVILNMFLGSSLVCVVFRFHGSLHLLVSRLAVTRTWLWSVAILVWPVLPSTRFQW